MESSSKEDIYTVPASRKNIIEAAIEEDCLLLMKIINDKYEKTFNQFVESHINTVIQKEVNTLLSNSISPFKLLDVNDADQIAYTDQIKELHEKAPLLENIIFACVGCNKKLKNKQKTPECFHPAIANSVSILLMCNIQLMNANAVINTLILRQGKADKMLISRFQKMNICLSHTSALKKQLQLGENCHLPIQKLKSDLEYNAKNMAMKISSALINKEESIAIDVTQDLLESSLAPLPTDLNDSFFDSNAKEASMEILENSIVTDESSSISK